MKWFSVSVLVKPKNINKRMKFRAHTLTMRLLHYTLLHVTWRKNCLVQNVILIGSVKQKIYQDVLSNKIVITNSKHFAQYVNDVCNSVILYLDKTDITEVDVTNAVYIPGMFQVHSVQRVGKSKLDFYTNSPYKKVRNLKV